MSPPILATQTAWSTVNELSSDHFPIIIAHQHKAGTVRNRQSYTNYNKINWKQFTKDIEETIGTFSLQTFLSIDTAVTHLYNTATKASNHHIPEGNIKDYNSNFSPHIKLIIKQKNMLKQIAQPTTDDAKKPHTH